MPGEPAGRETRRREHHAQLVGCRPGDAIEGGAIDVDGAFAQEVAKAFLESHVLGELVVGDSGHFGDDDGSGRQLADSARR